MFKSQTYSESEHGFIYFNNGDLYGFGDNFYGQLGVSQPKIMKEPTFIMNDHDIIKILCTRSNTLIYKKDGSILVTDWLYCNGFKLIFKQKKLKDIKVSTRYIYTLMDDDTVNIHDIYKKNTQKLEFSDVKNIFHIKNGFDYDIMYIYTKNSDIYIIDIDSINNNISKKYFKCMNNVQDIFMVENKIYIITNNTIEIHDEHSKKLIYNGNDINQVLANQNKLFLRTKDNNLYHVCPELSDSLSAIETVQKMINIFTDKNKSSNYHTNNPYELKFLYKLDKYDVLCNYQYLIILNEFIVDEEIYQNINIVESKFESVTRKLLYPSTNAMCELVYNTPIKIVGSGSLVYKFKPKKFILLANYIKRNILFLCLYFNWYKQKHNLSIPRYVKYLIYDWVVKSS